MNLGVAIAGAGGNRVKDDFYPTPPEAVLALLADRVMRGWPPDVWEPACGDGAMVKVLQREGFVVLASDLVDRGHGGGVDFLTTEHPFAASIITNPPFALAEQFIRHAFALGVGYVALLLKIQFWCAARRLPLWREHPPTAVLPLTWRLDFTGGGAPTMDCAWVVWLPIVFETCFRPLPQPVDLIG